MTSQLTGKDLDQIQAAVGEIERGICENKISVHKCFTRMRDLNNRLLDKVKELEADFDTCYKELEYERKRSDDLEKLLGIERKLNQEITDEKHTIHAKLEMERKIVAALLKHHPECLCSACLDKALTQKEGDANA